jgi:hypothetical protein
MTLGSVAGVLSILGRSENELSESEVEARLAEAERKIRNRHNNKFSIDKFYAVARSKTYSLFFTPKTGASVQVYVSGLLVDSNNYTVTNGDITFAGSFSLYSGDLIVVYYTPDFYDDYANYIAAERIYAVSLVDTTSAVGKAVYDSIKDTVREYERLAMSKPHVAGVLDHREDGGIH